MRGREDTVNQMIIHKEWRELARQLNGAVGEARAALKFVERVTNGLGESESGVDLSGLPDQGDAVDATGDDFNQQPATEEQPELHGYAYPAAEPPQPEDPSRGYFNDPPQYPYRVIPYPDIPIHSRLTPPPRPATGQYPYNDPDWRSADYQPGPSRRNRGISVPDSEKRHVHHSTTPHRRDDKRKDPRKNTHDPRKNARDSSRHRRHTRNKDDREEGVRLSHVGGEFTGKHKNPAPRFDLLPVRPSTHSSSRTHHRSKTWHKNPLKNTTPRGRSREANKYPPNSSKSHGGQASGSRTGARYPRGRRSRSPSRGNASGWKSKSSKRDGARSSSPDEDSG
jgi:hypothetical protein